MLPSIFGENLFDDFFHDPFGMMTAAVEEPLYGKHAKNLMKTDVRELEDAYELGLLPKTFGILLMLPLLVIRLLVTGTVYLRLFNQSLLLFGHTF